LQPTQLCIDTSQQQRFEQNTTTDVSLQKYYGPAVTARQEQLAGTPVNNYYLISNS